MSSASWNAESKLSKFPEKMYLFNRKGGAQGSRTEQGLRTGSVALGEVVVSKAAWGGEDIVAAVTGRSVREAVAGSCSR